ncbi:MAG: peptidoglycan-binding protein [Oscillospiraceae bacterium]|nr:peptidoglycan-binding protein [Oscillospiraceae bacterium]
MRPPESFIGQPIRSLQTMIRVIAQDDPSQPSLVPDGIYGPQTVAAVSTFQRNHGFPVTGIADQDTWEAIVAVYEPAITRVDAAEPLEIILHPGQVIRRGSREPNVYILQAILKVLSEVYGSITAPSLNGLLDEPTSISLADFQELTGLPRSGELDKVTWKHLARQYPLATNQQR